MVTSVVNETSPERLRVGVDVGGTFTDLVRFDIDPESGQSRVTTAKTATTPPDFERGVLDVLRKGGVPLREIDSLVHGTTVVINAVTERKGAKVGLITTEGFRDTLEIARGQPAGPVQSALRETEALRCALPAPANCRAG